VKVDYEKAYDVVDWNFLLYMIIRSGFNDKCIKWIKFCLESATILVLVNGSPIKEFNLRRGLRQGVSLTLFFSHSSIRALGFSEGS